jgi:hypothetical protein
MNSTSNFINLKKSYENANLIITTSKYSINYLKTMFPNIGKKIVKVNLSVDSNKFKIKKKINLITYMPRNYLHIRFTTFLFKKLASKKLESCTSN